MAQLHEINENKPKNTILVAVQLPGVSEDQVIQSLSELSRLVTTLGNKVVGRLSQKRSSERGATLLGEGKAKVLVNWVRGDETTQNSSDDFDSENEVEDTESEEAFDSGALTDEVDPELAKALGYDQKWNLGIAQATGKNGKSKFVTTAAQGNAQGNAEGNAQGNASLISTGEKPEGKIPDQAPKGSIDMKPEAGVEIEIVVFDCELSPSQIRNLEKMLDCQVMDRTGVIIEIFSRHARTRAARLQVEIARLTYLAPRLRETLGNEDRGGGGVGAKGAGESDVELDRRKIRDRIKELRNEFTSIEKEHETRRNRRQQVQCVALVGYTNAGKSSMMRALTGSDVLVADRLFATLDTTVRPIDPPAVPTILISDTVGFIKKLPHDLVASFKSTLDEALNASLLLFVVDCSDSSFREQLEVTQKVLTEVGVADTPSKLVLNKIDKLSEAERDHLRMEYSDAWIVSAKSKDDVSFLRDQIIRFFEGDMIETELFVPYQVQGAIGEIRSRMRVLDESYDGDGVKLSVRTTEAELARVKARFSI